MLFQTKIVPGVCFLQLAILFVGFLSLTCAGSRSTKVTAATTSGADATPLEGKWTVTSQSRTSLAIIPSCKPIQPGTIFQFRDKILEVYVANSNTPCDQFGVRVLPTSISLVRDDMIWLCNYELKANTLTLTSTAFFTTDQNDTIPSPNNQATTSGEVAVTLIKN